MAKVFRWMSVVWTGRKNAWFEVAADGTTDIAREANGAMMLSVKLKINAAPTGAVAMGVGVSTVPVTKLLKTGDVTLTFRCRASPTPRTWPRRLASCLATSGTLDISVYDVRLIETKTGTAGPIA
jgi:beta-glucosidase